MLFFVFKGITHENECIFQFHKCVEKRHFGAILEISSRGPCPVNETNQSGEEEIGDAAKPFESVSKRECDFFCDESWQPICDAKGHTHKNFCK